MSKNTRCFQYTVGQYISIKDERLNMFVVVLDIENRELRYATCNNHGKFLAFNDKISTLGWVKLVNDLTKHKLDKLKHYLEKVAEACGSWEDLSGWQDQVDHYRESVQMRELYPVMGENIDDALKTIKSTFL